MFVKWLGSTRFFYAPADKPNAGGAQDTNDTNDDGANDTGDDDNDGGTSVDDGDGPDDGDPDDDKDPEDDEDADPDADPEPKPEASASAKDKKDWRDRQLDRQHRKISENNRRIAELEAERAALEAIVNGGEAPVKKPGAAAPSGDAAPVNMAEAVKVAKTQLQAQSVKDKYDDDCNNLYAEGAERFKDDWDEKLKRIPRLGGIDDDTMQFLLATDDPAAALYAMADDPDKYEDIMGLPLAKRANALNKLGAKKAPERKRPSGAPPPIEPINGRRPAATRVNLRDDKVEDEAWFAQREKDRAARFERKRGGARA